MPKNSFWRDLWRILCLFSLLPLAFTLSSCLHFNRKDGPPLYHVDETKIPDAVPKDEPLSKFGNKTYKVKGQRYYPQLSSKGYDVVGMASWYGRKFHHRKTSSGEPFNMLAMTAAHKSLPLPTYVEVTNLDNDRKVVVKVNDRGPFASSRILDLSYVAAKKLGMMQKGTARVRVRALDPDEPQRNSFFASNSPTENVRTIEEFHPKVVHHLARKSLRSFHRSQKIFLEVGLFKEQHYAERLQKNLKSMFKQPVHVLSPNHSNRLYQVQIGPLHDRSKVAQIKKRLTSLGINVHLKYGA